MPAGVRGGSLAQAKPRPKATSKPRSAASRRPPRAVEYAPAKLGATRSIAISPALATAIAALIILAGVVAALATGGRWRALGDGVSEGLGSRGAALGFKLAAVHIEGASAMAQPDILRASGLHKDQPLLGLSLDDLRDRIEHVGWVKEAKVVRLLPDTMVIAVTERSKLAVWQQAGRLRVVDNEGHPIPEADPARFPNLPLVVGEGANETAAGLLPMLRSRPRLMQRLDVLVRVDDRRWDLRLKDGGIIQLPAIGEESALIRLDQLDRSQRILDLGFDRIDLRESDLVTVRPRVAPAATAAAPGHPATSDAAPPAQPTAPAAQQTTAAPVQEN